MANGGDKKCVICGRQIGYGNFFLDWAGNTVCGHHSEEEMKMCVSCGRFCGPKSIELVRGKWLCPVCQKHIITSEQCAKMAHWIKEVYKRCPIGHVEMVKLKSMTPEQMMMASGSRNVMGLAQGVGRDYTVYFYRHMSIVAFTDILAHELLHIWQYDHNIHPDSLHCEGFCNLGSWFILNAIGNPESKARMKWLENSRDPIYGDGFRLMKAFYDRGGWNMAISELKRNSDIYNRV